MKGRISKPSALKALAGNAGHRSKAAQAGREPAPPAGAPEPPAHLDSRARRKWYEIFGVMMQVAGWATLMDGDVVAAYCSAYSRWQEAEEQLPLLRAKMKRCKAERRGTVLNELNTMVGQQRHALKDMKSFGQEFGWSSASRTRIRLDTGQLALAGFGGGPTPNQPETDGERAQRYASA